MIVSRFQRLQQLHDGRRRANLRTDRTVGRISCASRRGGAEEAGSVIPSRWEPAGDLRWAAAAPPPSPTAPGRHRGSACPVARPCSASMTRGPTGGQPLSPQDDRGEPASLATAHALATIQPLAARWWLAGGPNSAGMWAGRASVDVVGRGGLQGRHQLPHKCRRDPRPFDCLASFLFLLIIFYSYLAFLASHFSHH
jgi:hypothetical protein